MRGWAGWRRVVLPAAGVTAVAGIGYGLTRLSESDAAVNWAQLASVALGVFALVPPLVGTWRRRQPGGTSTIEQIDRAERVLRVLVHEQWREEIVMRDLDEPARLPVRWKISGLDVMDQGEHVEGLRLLRSWFGFGRVRFDGRTDRMPEMASRFRKLDRRRLVILGEAGMGKTTLAVLLLRELLKEPQPGDRIPVLLSMSGWDPAAEPVHRWLGRRLRENYPALRAPEFGPDAARGLVAYRRILPVLDGLDELPEAMRPRAVNALNAASKVDSLILTCRTAEYVTAVNLHDGVALAGAAVIEPRPVKSSDVVSYLRDRLAPGQRADWTGLLSALKADPDGPLPKALSTPLVVWLLHKVYVETRSNPAPLCDAGRFPTAAAVTDHLLDNLVQASFAATSPDDDPTERHEHDHPFRSQRSWDPSEARRWLSFVARQMSEIGTRDFYWWHLHRAISRRWITLVGGVTVGLTVGVTVGLTSDAVVALRSPHEGSLRDALLFGLCGGPVGGLVGGLTGGLILERLKGYTLEPAYAKLRWRGSVGRLAVQLALGLVTVLPVGMIAAFALWRVAGISSQVDNLILYALVIGVIGGVTLGLNKWVTTPLTNDRPQGPLITLRRDLQLVYGRSLTFGLALGLAFGVAGTLVNGFSGLLHGAEAGIAFGLAGGVVFTLTFGFTGASSIYLVAVAMLRARGRIPLRLMSLLEDAHRVGLLRQVGPAYRFRHEKLQDRLAQLDDHDDRPEPK
ncbi:NACHT domain-containing protein [Microbispora rosea]|uniref:NACHT domain-containing protein n=1 Tax=Microbispora rosea TaxID=58117 RepID=A0A1N7ELQ4_9ACTN|nr:NACHT domain-containing protein [Microbispora rosea]GIH50054.1 NACHT domain-containing protein [Microbispora rosea subsp. rosea]SIR89008.1 NACHT domain-containing protein [Microbispora rosea]